MLFNKSLALYISALFGSKSMSKSVLLSCVGSTSSSVCCSSSGGSSSLSVWFASSGSSSSVLSSSVAVSIVWVLNISSSSSKIGVVSSGCSGFKICCVCLYSSSGINSVLFRYSLIMRFCYSFVGFGGVASSCVVGSCMLKYCVVSGSCSSNIL